MAFELEVPSVGESIVEVQIGQWLVGEGGFVEKGQPVVEIESDKATVELPAPVSGVVSKILKRTGEAAAVGDVIGQMEEGAAPAAAKPASDSDNGKPAETEAKAAPKPAEPAPKSVETKDEARVMPAAQRAMAEKGLSADAVKGTGPGGRILKEDVEQAAARDTAPQASAAPLEETEHGFRDVRHVPMSPMRKRIAERLVQAQQQAALLTTFNEVDMSKVMTLRKEFQEEFTAKHGVKLGFMSFFVKAVVEALKLIPQVNAQIEGEELVYHDFYDIGIAVGGGKGLVVPIIRNAETLTFAEIEKTIGDFGARAKANKVTLDELQGGTFSISNGGVYGSMLSTPIVNPPQSAILGLHNIQDRPVAVDGQVVIRPMMYLALTYDHRIIDGREAVTFLRHIKMCVENPTRMLLEV